MSSSPDTTIGKALRINKDTDRYGVFAEIGAGHALSHPLFQGYGTPNKSVCLLDQAPLLLLPISNNS